MAKVLLFNCKDELAIRQVLLPMKIRIMSVPADKYHLRLGTLASGKWGDDVSDGPVPTESCLVMCEFTQKQMDNLLLGLRKKKVTTDFKAILTPTNKDWDVNHLFFELAKEKAAIMKAMAEKGER